MDLTLTIFTPTFNRAHLLPRLYESLLRQEAGGFVWMVLDDGSTDGTRELVEGWKAEGRMPIEYLWQENGGKMRALNCGAAASRTPLFFCVDSDDYLTDGAVADILSQVPELMSGVGLCGLLARKRLLNRYKSSPNLPPVHNSSFAGLKAMGFEGETSLVFKTELLRRFPFPEIEGEKYISLSFCYEQIDREYEYLLVDRVWTICEYQQDGYSANRIKLKLENPKGWAMVYARRVRTEDGGAIERLKNYGHYYCFCLIAGYGYKDTAAGIGSVRACLLCWPLGVGYYLRLKLRYWKRYGNNKA